MLSAHAARAPSPPLPKHPQPLLTGTFDWLHLSHVFTARDEDVRFEFRITEATGTMWLDEIRLEEID